MADSGNAAPPDRAVSHREGMVILDKLEIKTHFLKSISIIDFRKEAALVLETSRRQELHIWDRCRLDVQHLQISRLFIEKPSLG